MSFARIAILGSGALGLYYGGRLARAGHDVTLIARGDVDHLRAQGVTVKVADGDFTLPAERIRVAASPAECGPVDLVIITLKATANDHLPALLPPLLHVGTVVLNLQNGLGVDEPVAAVAGPGSTVGGLCFICVNRIAPGTAECTMPGLIVIGDFAGEPRPRTRAIAELFGTAGVKVNVSPSLAEARWRKLVWNVPFNGLSVAEGGLTTDLILQSRELENEVWALMREVQAAARAHGFEIPEPFIVDQVERTRPMGPYKPSTMLDYLAGKPLELEPIWGEPLRRAKAKGVTTPRLEALYARLTSLGEM
ncbi:MAG: 2-dehydropantoate 2-reductase [Verrucomicrobiota bacterium]